MKLLGTNLLVAVALLLMGTFAPAQQVSPPKVDGLRLVLPYIDEAAFDTFVVVFDPSEAQRAYFEHLYTRYHESARAIGDRTAKLWQDAYVSAHSSANGEPREPSADDIEEMSRKSAAAALMGFTDADGLWNKLLQDVEAVVAENQANDWEQAVRRLNRDVKLATERQPLLTNYAGEGIDALALTAEASADGGELQFLVEGERPQEIPAGDWDAIVSEFKQRQDQYEIEVQAWIEGNYAGLRYNKIESMRASGKQDEVRQARLRNAEVQRSRALFAINRRYVYAIGLLLQRSGDLCAQRCWIDRFDEACHPRAFGLELPQLAYQWLEAVELPDEVRLGIDNTISVYHVRRDQLRAELRQIMFKCKWNLSLEELRGIRLILQGREHAIAGQQLTAEQSAVLALQEHRRELVHSTIDAIKQLIDDKLASELDNFLTHERGGRIDRIHAMPK